MSAFPTLSLPLILLALAVPTAHADGQSRPCPRGTPRSFPAGAATTVDDDNPPCRIVFRDTGIRLEASSDGSRPDPGRTVVVDSHGRYLSTNAIGWNAVVSVWDARGRYLSSFGRAGEGPGELSAVGMLNLYIDSRDNVHVDGESSGWSVFSSGHEFLRRVPSDVLGARPGTAVLLDDGSALASDSWGRDTAYHFRLVDSTGTLQRSFGPLEDGLPVTRRIAYAGGNTFWAGPPGERSDAYALEEWGTDGELRRSLERDVDWWGWHGRRETSPSVQQLHLAEGGLLYVLVWRQTEEYRREYARAARTGRRIARDRRDALTESVIEVIDTGTGVLLASEVLSVSESRQIVPRSLFQGSLLGYRYKESEDGLPFVEIVAVELELR